MARNEVKVTITGDASKLGSALGQAEGQLSGFQGRMEALGGKMREVGQTMTLGVTVPVVGAGVVITQWAGQLEDSQAMTAQVFGNSAGDLERWADTAAESFGLAKGDALDAANQIGIRLRQIGGLSESEAARVSTALTQLSGDLASAFGGSVDDASLAIQSALTGEFEPLKRYGVVINDAALKNKLFQMTGEEVDGTLTAQQKQMATLALITEQTGIVQGDYARNAEGATNSQRTMIAALKDAGTALGTILLPYVTTAVQFITNLVEKFQSMSPTVQKVIVIVAAVAAALGPVIFIAGALATAIGFIASPIGLVVAAIAGLVAAFVYFYNTNEGFREWVLGVVEAVRDWLGRAFQWFKDTVVPAVVDAFHTIAETAVPVLIAAFEWVSGTAIPALQEAFERIASEIVPIVQAAFEWIATEAIPALVIAFQWFRDNVVPVLSDFAGFLGVVFQFVVNGVVAAIDNFRNMATVIAGIMNWLWPVIEVVWGFIVDSISAAMTIIQGIIATVTAIISGDWGAVWDGIKQIAQGVWEGIVALVNGALGLLGVIIGGALSAISGAWSSAWGWMKDTASNAVNAVVGFFTGLPGRILGVVGSVASAAGQIGSSIASAIGNGIGNVLGQVGDIATKLWRGVAGFINDKIIDRINNFSVTVPIIGRVDFPNLPRLHTGTKAVPGFPGQESLYVLEAGESVRTSRQEAVVQNVLGQALDVATALTERPAANGAPVGAGVQLVSPTVVVQVDARGAMMTDNFPAALARQLEQFFADGGRMPRLAAAVGR